MSCVHVCVSVCVCTQDGSSGAQGHSEGREGGSGGALTTPSRTPRRARTDAADASADGADGGEALRDGALRYQWSLVTYLPEALQVCVYFCICSLQSIHWWNKCTSGLCVCLYLYL